MSDEEQTSRLASFLKDHPRLMGMLFTAVLLLTQSGTALAGDGAAVTGP